jgi:uncharacterized protein
MTTLTAPPPVASIPRAPSSRIVSLDVLRGIAILGTLMTNIGIFLVKASESGSNGFDRFLGTFIGLTTDGKYIGLLTIMFGIGLEIQRQSALKKGETWLGSYPWRAALLVLDGLLNYIFIFEFDVLMGYGLTALVVAVVVSKSPLVQKWCLGIGLALHVAHLTYLSAPGWFSSQTYTEESNAVDAKYAKAMELAVGKGGDVSPVDMTPHQLDVYAKAIGRPAADILKEWQAYGAADGGTMHYWDQVHNRFTYFWGGRAEIPVMFLMGLGLFLVGAFLYRAGIFEAHGDKLRKRIMLLSFGVGLPIDWVTRIWFSDYTGTFNRYLTSTFVSFGILALVAHFYAKGRGLGIVGKGLTNIGKMALTCYVGQNLIASILFYGWGFDLSRYLTFGAWNTVIAWTMVAAILVVFSTVWLRYFKRGPIEWVWNISHTWILKRTRPMIERSNAKKALKQAAQQRAALQEA